MSAVPASLLKRSHDNHRPHMLYDRHRRTRPNRQSRQQRHPLQIILRRLRNHSRRMPLPLQSVHQPQPQRMLPPRPHRPNLRLPWHPDLRALSPSLRTYHPAELHHQRASLRRHRRGTLPYQPHINHRYRAHPTLLRQHDRGSRRMPVPV